MNHTEVLESIKRLNTEWNLYLRNPTTEYLSDLYADFAKKHTAPRGTPQFDALLHFTKKMGDFEMEIVLTEDALGCASTLPILAYVLYNAEDYDKHIHQKLLDGLVAFISGEVSWDKTQDIMRNHSRQYIRMVKNVIHSKIDSKIAAEDENPLNP